MHTKAVSLSLNSSTSDPDSITGAHLGPPTNILGSIDYNYIFLRLSVYSYCYPVEWVEKYILSFEAV